MARPYIFAYLDYLDLFRPCLLQVYDVFGSENYQFHSHGKPPLTLLFR